MKNQERNIKDVLEKKVKISDEVEERLESTYEILRNRSKVRTRKQHKFPKVAAAVIVTALMVLQAFMRPSVPISLMECLETQQRNLLRPNQ